MGKITKLLQQLSYFKRTGYFWSLYICRDNKQLIYALHADTPYDIFGLILRYFSDGKNPVEPWELYLNFNPKKKYFRLEAKHFWAEGRKLSPELLELLEGMDPNWERSGREPMFVEAATKKELLISENLSFEDLLARANSGEPIEKTFFSVMDKVFGEEK